MGRKIKRVFDLQRRPVNRPNFYIYSVDQRRYNLAVHTFTNYPFSKQLGDYYYKVEVSNDPNEEIRIWEYNALMKNKAFTNALNKPLNKPDYIPHLREKIIKEVGF